MGRGTPSSLAFIIEYGGQRYHGFQWQSGLPTVQSELERAIGTISKWSSRVVGASRTDAGVHAKGQVVGFRVESRLSAGDWVKALNAHLPRDIVVRNGYRVGDDFRIRKGAVSREYRYCIYNRSLPSPFFRDWTCFVPQALDVDRMDEGAGLLCGEHDFSSFVTSLRGVTSAVRTVQAAAVRRKGDLVLFDVTADSFLPHQIRNTVGLLIRLGLHRTATEEFRDIMAAKRPGLARPTAPACGLYLTRVNYPRPLGSDTNEDLHS